MDTRPAAVQKVYVGHGNATGDVQIFDFDAAAGALIPVGTVATGSSTSYLAFAPGGRFAYTTQNRSNRVSAFAVEAGGMLRKLGDAAVPGAPGESDAGPAYLSVDAHGRFLLVANYRGHNVVVFRLDETGGIGPVVTNVSAGRHAHCVVLSPDNRFAFVPNLGTDLVAQYRFDAGSGALTPNDPPAAFTARGAGPRHLVFGPADPSGARSIYLINELDATLGAYAFDPVRGVLVERQTVPTLPPDYQGKRWAADLQVHPNGRFVYASNRAHESVSVFHTADLTLIQRVDSGGQTPRNFALDGTGRFALVANQDSAKLCLFSVDPQTGHLHPGSEQAVASHPYFVKITDEIVG